MKKMLLVLLVGVALSVQAVLVDGPVLQKVVSVDVSNILIGTTNGGALVVNAPYFWRDSNGQVVPGHVGVLTVTEPMLRQMLSNNFPAAKGLCTNLMASSANGTVHLQVQGNVISASILIRQVRPDGGVMTATVTWPDAALLGLPSAQILAGMQSVAQASVNAPQTNLLARPSNRKK